MRGAIGLALACVLLVMAGAGAQDLTQGSQGARVLALQTALLAVGEHPGPADGEFGPLTRRAVVDYQRSRGIAVDGIVGPATRYQLALVLDTRTLRPGDHGQRVVRLERALGRRGLYTGPVDGVYGAGVRGAVVALQRGAGVAVTGIVDSATQRLLWDPLITVTPGMTLSALALEYGVTAGAIATANHQSVNAFIDAGQRLTLPWPAAQAAAATTTASSVTAAQTVPSLLRTRGGPIALALMGPVRLATIGARLDAIGHPALSAFVPASTSRAGLEGLLSAGTEVDAELTNARSARQEIRVLDAHLATMLAPAAAVAAAPGSAISSRVARDVRATGAAYLVGFRRIAGTSPEQIATRALQAAAPGMVLMLPITDAALKALPAVLGGLERQGYQPEPVSQLLGG